MFRVVRVIFLVVVLAPWSPLPALTFIPPLDLGELARESEAVVLAEAGESWVVARGAWLFTRTRLLVLRGLSGLEPGVELVLEVPGGELADRFWIVPGSPRFRAGGKYLLSLSRKGGEDLFTPRLLGYGVLEETVARSGELLLGPLPDLDFTGALPRPDGHLPEPIVTYREAGLLDHLQAVLAGNESWDSADLAVAELVPPPLPGGGAAPAGCAFISAGTQRIRWQVFDLGGTATIFADATGDQSLAGGGFLQLALALDAWMSINGTSLNLVHGGAVERTISCSSDDFQAGTVVFNDPCSDMADLSNCGGVLAFGGPLGGAGTHRFDNSTWATATSLGVMVNNGSGCIGPDNYRLMLAHEVGHGLGFAHVQDPTAMMFANCCNRINATDTSCTLYTYPASDPLNQRPQSDAGGSRTLTLARNTARLEGQATDDGLPAAPGQLTTAWRALAGPGGVTFSDLSSLETAVSFEKPGVYLLGLSAWDGRLFRLSAAEVTVTPWAVSRGEAVFQQGAGGYRGTVDTSLVQNAPDADGSLGPELSVDSDDPSGSGLSSEVLLRFADLFGATAGQVPPGSAIRFARLELATTNQGIGASLHRMKGSWSDRNTWNTFGGNGIQAGNECFPEVETSVAGVSGTVAIDVTTSVSRWSEDPCANQGWVFLPAGTDGWDFSSAEGSQPPRLTVEYAGLAEEKLIALGDAWRYFKGTADPPAAWNRPGFAAGTDWASGGSGIGYGDGDDATLLLDMRGRYLTVYCRREFTVDEAAAFGRLELTIDYDDGFVAWLNGVEVARSASMGLPGAAVDRNTASQAHEAGSVESYSLDATLLRQGGNVLAIEVHNDQLDSSDLTFRPELKASRVVIDEGAEWKFWRGSAAPPADWMAEDADETAWETGRTGIGYGEGDDQTVLSDMRGRYLAVFCRKSFEWGDPASSPPLALGVIYDDGVVVYLNGKEIGRANMPAGAAGRSTAAAAAIDAQVVTFTLPVNLLKAGRNVLAASVHNRELASSDLSFVPVLYPVTGARAVSCGEEPTFRRGDTTGEGTLDLSDAIGILNFLFVGGERPACLDAADADDDGTLTLTDGVRVINYLFLGAAPPPAPGLECGADPTEDTLECAATCE